MQIQLKQTEIISALKMYIASQGINLHGKAIEIGFTAGRKEAGLSADITIEDNTPATFDFGVDGNEVDTTMKAPTPPILALVAPLAEVVASLTTPETDAALKADDVMSSAVMEEAPAKATTNSLFGN